MTKRPRTLCLRAWRQAAGTRLRLPCAYWSRAACRSPAASSGLAASLIGQIQPGPATESEVLEIRPSRSRPDRGTAVVRSLTRNQRNEVVQRLTAKLIVLRRV